jgi:hypothetical protein
MCECICCYEIEIFEIGVPFLATQRYTYGTKQSHKSIQIMRLPSLTTLIGAEIQGRYKCSSWDATRIVKFDPSNPDTTTSVGGGGVERALVRCGNGVLGGDGGIDLVKY